MKQTILTVGMTTDDPDKLDELEVRVLLGDQMRAELETTKRGLSPEKNGIHFLAAMAWAAMTRQGLTELRLEEFSLACADIQAQDEDDAPDVDPTRPAQSDDSASPWPLPTPDPASSGGSLE